MTSSSLHHEALKDLTEAVRHFFESVEVLPMGPRIKMSIAAKELERAFARAQQALTVSLQSVPVPRHNDDEAP